MLRVMVLAMATAGSGALNSHQALLLDGTEALSFQGHIVTKSKINVAKDEKSFTFRGQSYPNAGPDFWKMVEANSKSFDVLGRIVVQNGVIRYNGLAVDVGEHVVKVYQAVRWGDLVACLTVIRITHRRPGWFEEDTAHAVVIFVPGEGKGGRLLLPGKGSKHVLNLVDAVPARN